MGTTHAAAIEPWLNDIVPSLLALLEAPVCFPLERACFQRGSTGLRWPNTGSRRAVSRPGQRANRPEGKAAYLSRAESPRSRPATRRSPMKALSQWEMGASNTSPCIAEIRARSPIFNGCLPSASGDVRDRSNPRTGLACVDPKACPCMSTRRATSAGVSACRLRAQEADIGVWHGPIDSPDTTRRELQMDVLAKKVAIVTGPAPA